MNPTQYESLGRIFLQNKNSDVISWKCKSYCRITFRMVSSRRRDVKTSWYTKWRVARWDIGICWHRARNMRFRWRSRRREKRAGQSWLEAQSTDSTWKFHLLHEQSLILNRSMSAFTYVASLALDPMSSHSCRFSSHVCWHRDAFCTSASPCVRRRIRVESCEDRRRYRWTYDARDGREPIRLHCFVKQLSGKTGA